MRKGGTVTPIGLPKAVHIHFRAATVYHVDESDFIEECDGNWTEVVRDGKETGKVAHNFYPDAHYRTVGQSMGARPRP